MVRTLLLSLFVGTFLLASAANASYVCIWGSAQYADQADLGIAGTTFYNPFPGSSAKQHSVSLSGTTLYSSLPWAAQAYSAASLHTAELQIKAAASGAGFASAGARIVDTITFAGAYNGTCNGQPCYSIPVSYIVTGSISGEQELSAGIKIGSTEIHQKLISGTTTILSGVIHTTGTLALNIYINTDGYVANGYADFTNTARFAWQLPDGVTYTSDSGIFLAPEPGTVLMLIPGLIAFLTFGKRKVLHRHC